MKRVVFPLGAALLLFLTAPQLSQAQYAEGQIDAQAGAGLITFFGTGDVSIPLSLSVDYGLQDNIGVGAYLGYAGASEKLTILGDVNYTYLIVGARGTYHKEFVEGIDTYGGVLAGFNMASVSYENNPTGVPEPNAGGGFTYSFFAGARYHFTENLGAFAEVGYGISLITAGITYKMGG